MNLKRLCHKMNNWIREPIAITWNDKNYLCATNGVGMLLMETNPLRPEGIMAVYPEKIISVLNRIKGTLFEYKVSLSDLKAFLGEPIWWCDTCDGNGYIQENCPQCKGDGDIECGHCGSNVACAICDGVGKNICHACNGRGSSGKGKIDRYGWIFGIGVNLNILAQYLDGLTDEYVDVKTSGKGEPLFVVGNNWQVLIMPCTGASVKAPEFHKEAK